MLPIYLLGAGIALCAAGILLAIRARGPASGSMVRLSLGGLLPGAGMLLNQFIDGDGLRIAVAVLFTSAGVVLVFHDTVRAYAARRRGGSSS